MAARKRTERSDTGNVNSNAPGERKASGGMLEARLSRPEWRLVVYVADEEEEWTDGDWDELYLRCRWLGRSTSRQSHSEHSATVSIIRAQRRRPTDETSRPEMELTYLHGDDHMFACIVWVLHHRHASECFFTSSSLLLGRSRVPNNLNAWMAPSHIMIPRYSKVSMHDNDMERQTICKLVTTK